MLSVTPSPCSRASVSRVSSNATSASLASASTRAVAEAGPRAAGAEMGRRKARSHAPATQPCMPLPATHVCPTPSSAETPPSPACPPSTTPPPLLPPPPCGRTHPRGADTAPTRPGEEHPRRRRACPARGWPGSAAAAASSPAATQWVVQRVLACNTMPHPCMHMPLPHQQPQCGCTGQRCPLLCCPIPLVFISSPTASPVVPGQGPRRRVPLQLGTVAPHHVHDCRDLGPVRGQLCAGGERANEVRHPAAAWDTHTCLVGRPHLDSCCPGGVGEVGSACPSSLSMTPRVSPPRVAEGLS